MIRRLAALLLLLPACVVHYLVGTCPEGQVECDGRCADDCPTCPAGQLACADECRPATADCVLTGDDMGDGDGDGDATPTAGDHGDTHDADTTCDTKCGDDPCAACDPALERCSDDACACRPGLGLCDAACVDLRTDPAHCGDCDTDCKTGVCQNQTCREACAGDLAECDGACVDLKLDSLHCGNCATLCAPDEVCLAGTCRAYTPADDCDACPCPACGDGQACCPSTFLAAPVCVADGCGGD